MFLRCCRHLDLPGSSRCALCLYRQYSLAGELVCPLRDLLVSNDAKVMLPRAWRSFQEDFASWGMELLWDGVLVSFLALAHLFAKVMRLGWVAIYRHRPGWSLNLYQWVMKGWFSDGCSRLINSHSLHLAVTVSVQDSISSVQ